jgi:hypothetical protein
MIEQKRERRRDGPCHGLLGYVRNDHLGSGGEAVGGGHQFHFHFYIHEKPCWCHAGGHGLLRKTAIGGEGHGEAGKKKKQQQQQDDDDDGHLFRLTPTHAHDYRLAHTSRLWNEEDPSCLAGCLYGWRVLYL